MSNVKRRREFQMQNNKEQGTSNFEQGTLNLGANGITNRKFEMTATPLAAQEIPTRKEVKTENCKL